MGDYDDIIAHAHGLATTDIDHDGDDMGVDEEGDLGDIDLDDPELLAELQGLSEEVSASKPKPTVAPTPSKAPAQTQPRAPAQAQPRAPAVIPSPKKPAPTAKPAVKSTPAPTQSSNNRPSSPHTTPAPSLLASLGLDLGDIMEDKDDEDVELTEDDWNDPYLLAQLQAFGGQAGPEDQNPQQVAGSTSGRPAETTSVPPNDVQVSRTETQSMSVATESESLSSPSVHPPEPSSTSSQTTPNVPPKKSVSDVKDADGDSMMTDVPEKSGEPQETITPPIEATKPPSRSEEAPKKNDENLLKLLQTREAQYKASALDAKRTNNMTLAGERVKTLKSIRNYIRLVEAGGFLDLDIYPVPDEPSTSKPAATLSEPTGTSSSPSTPQQQTQPDTSRIEIAPEPPALSADKGSVAQMSDSLAEAAAEDVRDGMQTGGPKSKGIEFKQLAEDDDFQIVSNSEDDTYDMLQSQLESQIKMCTTTCAYYMKVGDKKSALEFHKLNKVFKADLVSLQSYRTHGKKAPAFHFQDVRFELEVGFYQEIGLNDLSLQIVRAWDLSHKDVQPSEIESYVTWDLGWPTEKMNGAGTGKGTTPSIKRSSKPEFNYSKTVGIERTKPFQRFIERKKVTFDVWHYRGLLWKAYLIGRAQVPLLPLLKHSEIHEIVPVLDPTTRRNTGGKVEIKIRLQRPLLGPEIAVKEEKWLVIDEFNSGGLGFPSPSTAVAPSRPAAGAAA
ncbi:Coiled-coil and C2 domain-containing protein 1B, partial [Mortierella sp. GBA43]